MEPTVRATAPQNWWTGYLPMDQLMRLGELASPRFTFALPLADQSVKAYEMIGIIVSR